MTAAFSTGGARKEDVGAAPRAIAEERGIHIQVRRIREEDLRIGAGEGEGLKARDIRVPVSIRAAAAYVDAVDFFRSAARPPSPLGKMRSAIESAS